MPDVVAFASEDWAESAAELWPLLPPAPGAEGTVSLAVSVAPRREVAFHWTYRAGVAVEGGAGAGGAPALALTIGAADAPEMVSGQVEPSVAFMRGRLKSSGEGALLLAFLKSTTVEEYSEWRRRLESIAPSPSSS
jgi:hypothetical protein